MRFRARDRDDVNAAAPLAASVGNMVTYGRNIEGREPLLKSSAQVGLGAIPGVEDLEVQIASNVSGEPGPGGSARDERIEHVAPVVGWNVSGEHAVPVARTVLDNDSNAAAGDDHHFLQHAKSRRDQDRNPALWPTARAGARGSSHDAAGREEALPDAEVLRGPMKLLQTDDGAAPQATQDRNLLTGALL
jgi:hypothetical protein